MVAAVPNCNVVLAAAALVSSIKLSPKGLTADEASLVPIEFVTVVAKFGSSPKEAANSFNVSIAAGEESTRSAIALSTYVSEAYPSAEPKDTPLIYNPVLSTLRRSVVPAPIRTVEDSAAEPANLPMIVLSLPLVTLLPAAYPIMVLSSP